MIPPTNKSHPPLPDTGLKKHTDNGSPVMSGICGSNQNGQQKYSLLNLNPCYANINGDLFPVTDGKGDFSKTCRDCFMPSGVENPAKEYMKCMCQQAGGDKVEKETQVDLGKSSTYLEIVVSLFLVFPISAIILSH